MSAKRVAADDLLIFQTEPETAEPQQHSSPWKILIVDDDDQVHKVTTLALTDIQILGSPLSFLHAFSAQEAVSVLEADDDIAVILLDVVMERDDSGLELARIIREEMKLSTTRIILRTGQPGYAPELEVIQNYDINDYRMKSELTRTRLITALTTAIRSYHQLKAVQQGEYGMRQIIEATNAVFNHAEHAEYCREVLVHIARLLKASNPDALLAMEDTDSRGPGARHNVIVNGALGRLANFIDLSIEEIGEVNISQRANRCIEEERSSYTAGSMCLFIGSNQQRKGCVYIEIEQQPNHVIQHLLEVFSVSIGVGFKNISLINQLNQFAYYDQLSRLPNRTRFLHEIQNMENDGEAYQVGVLDVDNFSSINNALGHKNGDLLIQAISDRLANSLPSVYSIARIGGDTFGILGPEQHMHPSMLLGPFERPFVIKNTPLPIRATLGLAKVDNDPISRSDVLKRADMAMKIAKGIQNGSHAYYSDEMASSAEARLAITRDLHPAISRDEFVIYYQPQVNIHSKKISGVESLVRWKRQDGTMVSPDHFIPVAESTGLIIEIGKQIFRKACQQAVRWKASGMLNFVIAINVSVRQFMDPDFIASFKQILREEEISADHFELEITESVLMSDVESVIGLLTELNKMGFSLSIDDFGTGYSSLNYLLRLPIQRLKVDRSFVTNLEQDERARSISELIVSLANGLGLATIAEGIETSGQLDFMQNLGCMEIQGYFFSPPLPAEEFDAWFNNFNLSGGQN